MNPSNGFIPDDIHICGACRKQFSDVEEFVKHKKQECPVLLSLQSGNQSVVQSEVTSQSVLNGNQITQTGTNRLSIPLPSEPIQDAYGNHQRLDTGQVAGAENRYQDQQVSSTEEVASYDPVAGSSLQHNQGVEYADFADGSEVLQQPLGHEYVRTQHRRDRYYVDSQDQVIDEPSSQLEEASSTDMLTGSQIVISHYQNVQPEYVLQQVNQSDEVYDGLVPIERQSALPPEPVYTLETHDEPVNQSQGSPQGNFIQPSNDAVTDNDLINLTPASIVDVNSVSNSLSFESQLPGTFSLNNSGHGGKLFQQTLPASQTFSNVPTNNIDASADTIEPSVDNIDSQVNEVVNEASLTKSVVTPRTSLHSTVTSEPSQGAVQNKTSSIRQEFLRLLNRPDNERKTDKVQQEKSQKRPVTKDSKTEGTTKTAPEKKFSCQYEDCSYRSAYMKDLERHYRTHTGEKPFSCTTCGKSFNRNDKLILHMRYHSGEKSFKCQLCDYSCVESGSLKKHVRTHTEDRPFKCQVCPYSSRSSGQLQIHLRSHTGDKPYVCAYCGAAFKVTSDLKRHTRTHTGEKPYACDRCDYRCSVKSNLKSHMKVNHSSEHELECHTCNFKSSSKKMLREHFKLHEIKQELTCSECGYQCSSKSALKNHMLKHDDSESNLIKCNYCDYKTRQAGNVVSHMKRKHPSKLLHQKKVGRLYRKYNKGHAPYIVSDEGREECSKVETSSKVKAKCKKTYKCTLCDNSFVREDSLRCHVKQHRDLSKSSSLSTAYAVLKLQQPVINVEGNWQSDTEIIDVTEPVDPAEARAGNQDLPQSDPAIDRTGQGQAKALSSQFQVQNLGIKDILAAAGINNGAKSGSPRAVSVSSPVNSNSLVTSSETMQTSLFPRITIAQNPQDVPTVQVMQNISLPYIRLPDGQILVLGQSTLNQAALTPNSSPSKNVTTPLQGSPSDSEYPITLQQVQTIPIPQQISIPVSASQPGAIPIQIIVPSDSQNSLVTQLLNSSLNAAQSPLNKQLVQTGSPEVAQNYVVHIPGNAGNLTKTSGPVGEGQSQSYVLQIPGSGPKFCIEKTLDQQQNIVALEQVVPMEQDQESEDPINSSL